MKKFAFISSVVILLSLISLVSYTPAATLTYEYDANGNLINGDGKYHEYNDANQLVRVKQGDQNGPVIAEYVYDYAGQRIKKIENGVTTYYIGKHFETQVTGSTQASTSYYFANGERVAKKDPAGAVLYYHSDHLGGTNVVTNVNGALVERTKYFPFGEVREGGNEKYLYTGKEKDKLTDNYYYEARYYNPAFKHFTQADWAEPDYYDPQDLNRYAYARDNPTKFIDPDGHKFEDSSGHKWRSKSNYLKYRRALIEASKYARKSAKAAEVYAELLDFYSDIFAVPSGFGSMAISIGNKDIRGLLLSTGDTSLAFYRLGFNRKGPRNVFEIPGYITHSREMVKIGDAVDLMYSFSHLNTLKSQGIGVTSGFRFLDAVKSPIDTYRKAGDFFNWRPW